MDLIDNAQYPNLPPLVSPSRCSIAQLLEKTIFSFDRFDIYFVACIGLLTIDMTKVPWSV